MTAAADLEPSKGLGSRLNGVARVDLQGGGVVNRGTQLAVGVGSWYGPKTMTTVSC